MSAQTTWCKLDTCPVCKGKQVGSFLSAADFHYGNSGKWTYSKCEDCALVFLNPMPTEASLASFYPTNYYSFQAFDAWSQKIKKFLRRLLFIPLGLVNPKGLSLGKALDIGCGTGAALVELRAAGWDTFGVEISEAAAQIGNENYGLTIFPGSLLQANYPNEHFDYVRANHSIEHMVNPQEVFREIARVTKPDGVICIGVPNALGLGFKLFKEYWFLLGAPVHTFLHTEKSLSILGKSVGLELIHVRYNSDYASVLDSTYFYLQSYPLLSKVYRWLILRNPICMFFAQRMADAFDFVKQGDVIEVTYKKYTPSIKNPSHS